MNAACDTSLTRDLTADFFTQIDACANALQTDPMHLLRVAYAESGCIAKASNHAGSGAVGLIQWMPDTLRVLGWKGGADAFGQLTAAQQVPWIQRYMQPYKGRLRTLSAVYCAVFMPVAVDLAADASAVLSSPNDKVRGWAFAQNAALDANHDGRIVIGELELAVVRNCKGGRFSQIVERATGRCIVDSEPSAIDLRSVLGIQRALSVLGYPVGPIDGVNGPRTKAAVVSLQRAHGLVPNGIPDKLTRAAIGDAFRAIAPDYLPIAGTN